MLQCYLVPYLVERQEGVHLEKKGNKVLSISVKSGIMFRDITKMLSPGVSLKKFGESFSLKISKAHFPFAFLDSIDKLNYPGLPMHPEVWLSDLGGLDGDYPSTTREQQLILCQKKIDEAMELFLASNCVTLGDYLREYLKLDGS